jgi:hypothetical protein
MNAGEVFKLKLISTEYCYFTSLDMHPTSPQTPTTQTHGPKFFYYIPPYSQQITFISLWDLWKIHIAQIVTHPPSYCILNALYLNLI